MNQEVMDRFFLLKTQSAPTRPIEISSFKEVLSRNFPFGGCPSKKASFWGSFGPPNGYRRKIKKTRPILKSITITPDTERPFWVMRLG